MIEGSRRKEKGERRGKKEGKEEKIWKISQT
jgi:hypothetical protein